MENKESMEKEITQAVDKSVGWDELPIQHIEKFGKELCVKTDKGEVFIPARKFFEQYEFRARAFEELTVYLEPVPSKKYGDWLAKWMDLIKDLKAEDDDLIDQSEDRIRTYLNKTEEIEYQYLDAGRPIVLEDDSIAFKSGDLHQELKKENINISMDQLYFILRRMGCKAKQIGKERRRVWIWIRPSEGGK